MSELLKINVNDHVEKKNGLTYLSWAWAWAEVLKIDPQAVWTPMNFNCGDAPFKLLLDMPDGTVFVGVAVTIKGVDRVCLLPVMDHRNKAIVAPNSFDVNKALMRCLAKAIAMHGLGLYIYAGEDMPEQPPEVIGMSPDVLADWLLALRECGDDEVAGMLRDGLAAATEVKDKEAYIAIRQAGQARKAAA